MTPILAVFHIYVLFVLLVVFAASCVVYWQLERRWTTRRQWVSVKEWGRANGFRVQAPEELEPIALLGLLKDARVRIALSSSDATILQIDITDPALQTQWNLLVRRGSVAGWPATALRPTQQSASVVDLLSMQSFPLVGPTERFVVFGVDSAAARKLSNSSARGLLPPDVGLILLGDELMIDFSSRPFDTIEFERMLAVSEQLARHLS